MRKVWNNDRHNSIRFKQACVSVQKFQGIRDVLKYGDSRNDIEATRHFSKFAGVITDGVEPVNLSGEFHRARIEFISNADRRQPGHRRRMFVISVYRSEAAADI